MELVLISILTQCNAWYVLHQEIDKRVWVWQKILTRVRLRMWFQGDNELFNAEVI